MDDDVPETKDPLPPGVKNYMTPEGAGRLRKELAGLVNGERRIEYLERMLDRLEVVDPDAQDPSRALFGATVSVRDRDGGGGKKAYRIVGIDESDPSRGRVSWISPVARPS